MPIVNKPAPEGPGATGDPPKDVAIGTGTLVATNFTTATLAGGGDLSEGWVVPAMSKGILLAYQQLKHFSFVDSTKYAWGILLVMGIAIGVGVAVYKHDDLVQWIARGCTAAYQAVLDYASFRISGIGGLPPAATTPQPTPPTETPAGVVIARE